VIEDVQSPGSQGVLSFVDIVARLKENHFEVVAGVDSEEVAGWVSWDESVEQSGTWE
jgi:hypothetical protein